MPLRDIFKKSFWKDRLDDTIEGFAQYGRAMGGMPPLQPPPEAEKKDPPAPAQKKPEPPAPKTP